MEAHGLQQHEEHKSMWQLIGSQFMEHKLAVAGLLTILILIAIAIFAPVLAKGLQVDPTTQNVFYRYQPPGTTIEISKNDRVSLLEDFLNHQPEMTHLLYTHLLERAKIMANSDELEALYLWVESRDLETLRADLTQLEHASYQAMRDLTDRYDSFHVLGTDELGRDVFMRLVYGSRVSIGVGILVAVASALIGLLIGSLAGFYGGVLDSVLMRFTDSLLSLPQMPVLIVFAAVDLSKAPLLSWVLTQQNESVAKLVIVLCLFSWMTVARLVRGSVISLREREFVLASRTLGARDRTLILTHMLPNVMAPLLVTVTVNVGQSILYEAALSFLGLGIQPPTPSWGNMLSNAQELVSVAPLLAIIPGLLIFLTVISFNFIGDGLQQAIDPKAVQR